MGGTGTGTGTGSSSSSSPCASCKLLRRRCAKDCIFAPYFPPEDPHKFAIVHKVFGAANVSKMLQDLAVQQRADAVSSLVYEANARIRDPVYGCVGAISYLQHQVSQLQMQLAVAKAEILCMQVHNQDSSSSLQLQMQKPKEFVLDGKSYLLQHGFIGGNNNNIVPQPQVLLNNNNNNNVNLFPTGNANGNCNGNGNGNGNVMLPPQVLQEPPLKKESLWT